MDTSDSYAQMCAAAYDLYPELYSEFVRCVSFPSSIFYGDREHQTLLPHVYQLKAVITSDDSLLVAFMVQYAGKFKYDSLEKLLLHILMYEHYNRLWNGETWRRKRIL